jgi:hypothetical protein
MKRDETIRGSNSGPLWLGKDNAIPSLYSATMTGICRAAARLALFIRLQIQNEINIHVVPLERPHTIHTWTRGRFCLLITSQKPWLRHAYTKEPPKPAPGQHLAVMAVPFAALK